MRDDESELRLAYTAIEKELSVFFVDDRLNAWQKAFEQWINDLIVYDFNRLILILYRLDISESRLKKLLESQEPGAEGSAATIIGNLIIERQLEKIKSRRQYRQDKDISEDEKW